MQSKNFIRLGAAALLVAWSFDLLFWRKAPGISFPIFILLCLAAGFYLTWREDLRPALESLALVIPILFFSWMPFLRLEPMTVFVSSVLAFSGMLLLSLTWTGGRWWLYNLGDYAVNILRWLGQVLTKPAGIFIANRKTTNIDMDVNEERSASWSSNKRVVMSILFGLLLALPVVGVLGALLTLADPIFARLLEDALSFLRLDELFEYIFRFSYILVLAYLLGGVYLYALFSSRDEKVSEEDEPRLKPFLGWVEAVTLLVCVDVLFAAFVAVQFRYFFGGSANIQVEGYTYAEYARRGFAELVIVAFLSLLLLWGLGVVTRRGSGWARRAYSILSILLVGLVAVILVSAFQRLLLYEAAYGFTRLRLYTHVFMIWLGILLGLLGFLEATRRGRYFALGVVITCIGFGATLGLMNVDGTIVGQNLVRAAQGKELDAVYLVSLSEDAVPYLVNAFDSPQTSAQVREMIGGVLACRAALAKDDTRSQSWPSFHWSREQADRLYQSYEEQLEKYPVYKEEREWKVKVGGVEKSCQYDWSYGE